MPYVTVPANTWTSIITTTSDTIFQNRGAHTIHLTTESTAGLDADEGIAIGAGEAVVISADKSVSANPVRNEGVVFYTEV